MKLTFTKTETKKHVYIDTKDTVIDASTNYHFASRIEDSIRITGKVVVDNIKLTNSDLLFFSKVAKRLGTHLVIEKHTDVSYRTSDLTLADLH